jgi:hypothetical protein
MLLIVAQDRLCLVEIALRVVVDLVVGENRPLFLTA